MLMLANSILMARLSLLFFTLLENVVVIASEKPRHGGS